MIPERAMKIPQIIVIDDLELLKVDHGNIPMKIGGVHLKLVPDFLPDVGPPICDGRFVYRHQTLIVQIIKSIENVR